jgi:opacity protein-like surface antigen
VTGRILLVLALLATYAASAWSQEGPFYLRLDTGYSWARSADYHDRQFSPFIGYLICGDPACATPMSINHLGTSAIGGLGAGWRFSPQLRADLTVGVRKFAVNGQDRLPEIVTADVTSVVGMLNGYWDLPYGNKLKPFVGAGVGYARNSTGTTTDSFILFPGTLTATGSAKYNVAYSLSAGVGYEVVKGLVVEAGYRYIDLGRFQSGEAVGPGGPLTLPFQGAEGKLRANEFTLGIRY